MALSTSVTISSSVILVAAWESASVAAESLIVPKPVAASERISPDRSES